MENKIKEKFFTKQRIIIPLITGIAFSTAGLINLNLVVALQLFLFVSFIVFVAEAFNFYIGSKLVKEFE